MATQRQRLTRLVGPVAATVQQVAVHTEGGVVTPAQALLIVVPKEHNGITSTASTSSTSSSPGMNVTVEIKTGRRRVIEYLLSPVQRAAQQSQKER